MINLLFICKTEVKLRSYVRSLLAELASPIPLSGALAFVALPFAFRLGPGADPSAFGLGLGASKSSASSASGGVFLAFSPSAFLPSAFLPSAFLPSALPSAPPLALRSAARRFCFALSRAWCV